MAPPNWAPMYSRPRVQRMWPEMMVASVTAGLRWPPEMLAVAYTAGCRGEAVRWVQAE